nr:(2Fe-2S) ferredoxin domain-containing protein [Biomaibacter acetigenes]
METFQKEIEKRGLSKEVRVVQTGCLGLCELGPNVLIYPEGSYYCRVKAEDVPEIVEEHLVKGRIVERLLYKEHLTEERLRSLTDIDFYKKQKRIALRNCGLINPEVIEEYIANDGYKALAKVLTQMKPQEVIDEIKNQDSGVVGAEDFPPATSGSLQLMPKVILSM